MPAILSFGARKGGTPVTKILVEVPDSIFDYVPFDIYRGALGGFYIDPDFDLQHHANIEVTTTYYVDKNAVGAGTGADWDNALTTMGAAFTKPDVDRIYVRNSYFYRSEMIGALSRSVEIIAADNNVTFTSDRTPDVGAFAPVDSHYEAAVAGGEYIAAIYDAANLDAYGYPTKLDLVGSVAACDAAPNSHFWSAGGNLYVHTFDSRAPDGDLTYFDSLAKNFTVDGLTIYMEGIKFGGGGFWLRNSTAAGGLKVYLQDCEFYRSSGLIHGLDEFIMIGTLAYGIQGDAFNYDVRNGIVTSMIEVDCIIKEGGSGGSDQPSTGHNACNLVRINGEYYDYAGQGIADVSACQSWAMGLYIHDTGNGCYLGGAGGNMWLDTVKTEDCGAFDLVNEIGSITYFHQCEFLTGANSIGGSLVEY